MKAIRSGILAVMLVSLPATSADANHSVHLVHRPPDAAIADADVALAALHIGSCAPACSSVTVRLHVRTAGGTRTQTMSTVEWTPAAPVVFIVPGDQVGAPSISYWFEAEQRWCIFSYDCHVATTRAPAEGLYRVPVIDPRG